MYKVHIYYIPARVHTCNIICNTQVCEHFKFIAKGGYSRKLTVGRGLTPNMVAAHLWNTAPLPVFSREPYPLASQNMTVLDEL